MPKPDSSSQPSHRVRGVDLDKPHPTAAGWALVFLYFALPAMLLGAIIDLVIQWGSGDCVGLWCWLLR
jgi:hypothetical protein